jgi:hypothetical protein
MDVGDRWLNTGLHKDVVTEEEATSISIEPYDNRPGKHSHWDVNQLDKISDETHDCESNSDGPA